MGVVPCFETYLDQLKVESFCQSIADNQKELETSADLPDMNALNFKVAHRVDMVGLALRLLQQQDIFRARGISTHVDIGYHYTRSENLARICSTGLLPREDRLSSGISSLYNGSTFGDGIYTANNPYSYHAFAGGDVCFFVARIKGQTASVSSPEAARSDTILGRIGDSDEVCVLKQPSQCFVLAHFSAHLVDLTNDASLGNSMVHIYHERLQRIVDRSFNETTTPVFKLLPSQAVLRKSSIERRFVRSEFPVDWEDPDRDSTGYIPLYRPVS